MPAAAPSTNALGTSGRHGIIHFMRCEPGQILGDFEIVRPLGRGGLGAVYEATHLISRRTEALKVVLPEQAGTPEMAERFRREIQLLASLNHPNIASLHNAFLHAGQLVMVMELVAGEDLRILSRRTRIPLPLLLDYAAQALAGLAYAHSRGVVHRDLKPANIMVTPTNLVKLLDFGIATTGGATGLTMAGSLIGSPTHMSPEQARGERATPQSDIYSFGITLYELIAGEPPLKSESIHGLLTAHIYQVPRPLRDLRADVPASLSDIIARALEKDPAQRFATAADLLAALLTAIPANETAALEGTATLTPVHSWQRPATDELQRPTPLAAAHTDTLVRHLATFIGPIAKVVVKRLAKDTADLDRLYAEAARQIDNDTDRQRFLRTRPR